ETDRRRIRQRIQAVRREIDKVRRERATRREARERFEAPIVALVGYTNAGKSTLFNTLTRAATAGSGPLLLTLHPLVRRAPRGAGWGPGATCCWWTPSASSRSCPTPWLRRSGRRSRRWWRPICSFT